MKVKVFNEYVQSLQTAVETWLTTLGQVEIHHTSQTVATTESGAFATLTIFYTAYEKVELSKLPNVGKVVGQ